MKEAVSAMVTIMLLVSMLTWGSNIQRVRASGTVHIRSDGGIDPPTVNITTTDNVTYAFTGDVNDSIVIERNNTMIDGKGHTLLGSEGSYGVYLSAISNVTIKNTNIKGFDYGIVLDGSSCCNTISDNNITANKWDGIALWWSSNNNSIIGNNITNNWGGIWLYRSSNCDISGNTFVNDGLRVDSSSKNVVKGNVLNGKPLVYLEGVSDFTVENAGQVILVNCNRIQVENLDLHKATMGVELWETDNSKVSGNNITNNYEGVEVLSSNNNSIVGNNIANNLCGITLSDSSSNSVSGNNITQSISDGIQLFFSSENSIVGNNVATNGNQGFWLDGSSSNLIYHNNIDHNVIQVSMDSPDNSWDDGYPSGGNYWSDYAGADQKCGPDQDLAGSDGIGDTPYNIKIGDTPHFTMDRYPLTRPWVPSTSKVWTVSRDGSADFHAIQEAVDAANNGDTLYVRNGVYLEHVSVTKTISLVGENPFNTIIDAHFSSLTAILIHADNVTIRNLTVRNSSYSRCCWDVTGGIYLDRSNGCTIENCIATGNQNGINLEGSSGNTVSNNLATDNVFGIKVGDSSNNNLIKGNWMINNSYYGDSMVINWNTNNNTILDNCFYNGYNSLSPRPNSLIIYSPATGVVYHNDFMNNLPLNIDAQMGGLSFTWSKDGEGNFWIDYTGVDTDEDGLGDAPYIIRYLSDSITMTYGSTNDSYPLMKPYKWLSGDVNYDMIVNILDISMIAKAFGSNLGGAKWNPRSDMNNDKTINILDITLAASNFGKRMSWPFL